MNPVAFITGAASGIGRHFAQCLLEQDYRLIVADVNQLELERTFGNAKEVLLHSFDVRNAMQWQQALSEAIEHYGRLDYLFNIAGVVMPGFIHETSIEAIDQHMDVNAKGVMYGSKLAAEYMVQQGSGHIINVASLAGVAPIQGISLYSASKFAVRGFSLALSYELEQHNVNVSVVCPDLVDTPMLDLQLDYQEETALTFSGPKRPLQVEEVADALLSVMKKKRREVHIPQYRGWLALLGNAFPVLGSLLLRQLTNKGLKQMKKLKKKRHFEKK